MTAPARVGPVPEGRAETAPRHPWCDEFCGYLARAARGRALAAVAKARPGNRPGSLVLLPVFAWLPPAISAGRKTRNPAGPAFTLPVRLTYDTGEALILRAGQSKTVGVRARGMGHDIEGAVTVSSVPGLAPGAAAVELGGDGLPSRIEAGVTASVSRAARQAADDASLARWEAAMSFLLPYAEQAADRAISVLRSSAGSGCVPARVRDAVIDKLAYGITRGADEPGRGGQPPLLRLVDRCCEPDAFGRADPARIVSLAIRRDARDAAQSVTGDTRLGPKLRGLAGEIGPGVTAHGLADEANQRRLSAAKVTEGKARIALGYVLPSEVALPPSVTGALEQEHR